MNKPIAKIYNKEYLIIFFLFALALLLRLAYLCEAGHSVLFDKFILDAHYYDTWAMEIARGNWIGKDVFYGMPLYPYFLGLIYSIFGRNIFIAKLIQSVIGAFSPVLVYLIAKSLLNKNIALIAGFITAAYGMFIFYEGELIDSGLSMFLYLAAMYSLLWAGEKHRGGFYLLAGIILGLAGLSRAGIFSWVPFAVFWIVFLAKEKRVFVNAIKFILGVLLVISVVAVRNSLVAKDFVLITGHSGINFYIGNNENSDGTFNAPKNMSSNCEDLIKDSKFFAQKELGRALKASEVSKYWFLKSLAFIKNSPLQFIRLFLRKVALFWDAFEIPDVQDYYFAKSQSRFLKIPFWSFVVIAPLSLLGMLLAIRDCKRLFLPYSFIIAYVCSVALYFVNSRYRLPAIPVLIIFASFSLWWFSVKFGKKEYIRLILALMVLVSLFVLTNRRHITLNFSDSYNNTGDIFRREGRLEEAALYYEKAIMANPNNAKAYNDLGFVYLTQGRLDEASRMFHKSMEIEPQNPRALNNLGLISFRGGENVAAIEQFKKAIDLSPGLSEAHNNLGVAYAEISAYEKAIQEFKESVAINPNDLAARYNLGLLYAKKGLIQEAINEANNILLLAPDHGGAKELLAILKAGDTPSNPSTEPVLP